MALTKTVTKMFPTENTVGLHLVLKDDAKYKTVRTQIDNALKL